MKMFNANEVKDLVLKSPIKEIRGNFRFNLPSNDWDFGVGAETLTKQLDDLENFLKESKPWALFETEKGEGLGKFVIEYDMFDGDPPNYLKSEYFFAVPLENGDSLLVSLQINAGWPYYEGGGKFSISLNLD
jgi:hypothetical protein